jgi:1,4-alpha-glucan branching enzyme
MSPLRLLPLLLLLLSPVLPAQQVGSRAALPPTGPAAAGWDYYQFTVWDGDPQIRVTLTQGSGDSADLYLRKAQRPTLRDYAARSARPGTSDETVVLNASTSTVLTSGTWHIGVWRTEGTQYSIAYGRELIPSQHDGMGSTLFRSSVPGASGTAFRVWAPNAAAVSVAGSFNNWSTTTHPLVAEGNGNWSVDVRNVAAGAQYQYVIDTGLWTQWRNDPRADRMTHSAGNSVVYDHAAFDWGAQSWSTPAWNDMVVYEMHVGTFNDVPGGLPGTLASAAQKLPYLQDLGVNVIELMPMSEFPGEYSWGYNPANPFAVESHYGGPDALKAFIKAAHERGIAVVLDTIHNHYGPGDLDLWEFDGWSANGYGGIYFYNDVRAQTPWGDTRPDYGRGEVRQYIRDNAMNWLSNYRFDGLRWDSTSYMRNGPLGDIPEAWSLMQWVNDEIDWSHGWTINIAEDMWSNPWITKETGAGGAGFDSQWDALFVHPVRAAVIEPNDANRNMWSLRDAIRFQYNGDATQRVIYTESHDEVANGRSRVPEEIWPGNASSWFSKKRSTLGAALVMTSPGVPMIFQGQEFLEDGYFDDHDPLDWNKLNLFPGIRDLYRDLIRLRRDWYDNTAGLKGQGVNVHHVNDTDKVLAFHRWDQGGPGDDVVVLVNMANRAYPSYLFGVPRGGDWRVRFNSDWDGYDPAFGNYPSLDFTALNAPRDGMPYTGDIAIGPYSVVILSQ